MFVGGSLQHIIEKGLILFSNNYSSCIIVIFVLRKKGFLLNII